MLGPWLQYIGASVIVVGGSWLLARFGDAIGEQTGLGRVGAGMILLATATSLPELVTGVAAVRLEGAPDLAAGGAFGANCLNLLVLVVLGLKWRALALRSGKTTRRMGFAGLTITAAAAVLVLVGREGLHVPELMVKLLPVGLLVLYVLLATWTLRQSGTGEEAAASIEGQERVPLRQGFHAPLPGSVLGYLAAVAVVLGAGIWLAYSADSISQAMGWSSSFVGAQFLPLSTTLPELSVAIASLRIGAPDMAISTLLGSNMFNTSIVLASDSFAHTEGAFFRTIAPVHVITAGAAIVMTLVLLLRLQERGIAAKPASLFKGAAGVGIYAAMSASVFVFG
ncbi:MAG: hypothetical protein HQ548_08755 [Chloroflexi bacterium]|nr:hypothetical protein [Chloroflexota bacterium]